jgi:hypothetical protein
MLDITQKTEPFVATVRQIKDIKGGGRHASFDDLNSWYSIPPQLNEVVSQAADSHRPIRITTSRSAILSAELEPVPPSTLSTTIAQFMSGARSALGGLLHPHLPSRRADRADKATHFRHE